MEQSAVIRFLILKGFNAKDIQTDRNPASRPRSRDMGEKIRLKRVGFPTRLLPYNKPESLASLHGAPCQKK
jgi:hypothetical protein